MDAAEHFGIVLKKSREARGLSIADVARATKIKESSLALLEEARLSELPAVVFVRGYVVAYCRLVGADETEVLRSYRQLSNGTPSPDRPRSLLLRGEAKRDPEPRESENAAPSRRRWWGVLLILALLVGAWFGRSQIARLWSTRPRVIENHQ